MVTMSTEKLSSRHRVEQHDTSGPSGTSAKGRERDKAHDMDDANHDTDNDKPDKCLSPDEITTTIPNQLLYGKMETIIERMQNDTNGVPVRTVKSIMTKIPSVFTGSDLIMWMGKNLKMEQTEALHLAHLLASHGYLFPIDDHVLTVKNDHSFYRFQTPYFWPSNCWEPENTDYAVYLCKRTMQNKTRLELADYEAENLAKLQKMFSRKWEFIFMQAEAQSKVDKKREKLERKVLDSQERAFWDVHRPVPGCVNTTEVNIRKAYRINRTANKLQHQSGNATQTPKTPATDTAITQATTSDALKRQIARIKLQLERRNIKMSKVAEALMNYYEQYLDYDYFLVLPENANPWITDSSEFWEQEKQAKDISVRRVKRWSFSLQEILQDPVGREHLTKFLEKEYSCENLRFWQAVQELKALPQSGVANKVKDIWNEFLAPDASCPINVDSHSYELTKKNVENPDRWCFDTAAAHVYHLMKSDSYSRYIRSDMYKDFLSNSKKKTSMKGIRSIVSFSTRKENNAT